MMRDMGESGRKDQGMSRLLARHAAVALLLALSGAVVDAQNAPAPPPAAPPENEVEVIVFRILDQRGTTQESDQPPTTPETGSDPGKPVPEVTDAIADEAGSVARPPASLQLGAVATRLGRSAQYELLYHGGWTQEIPSQSAARPTPLPGAARQSGLQGTLTLYHERYLHVLVDVTLNSNDAGGRTGRIRQGRRLRGQAVQYFDHPQFGIILVVRPRDTSSLEATAQAGPAS